MQRLSGLIVACFAVLGMSAAEVTIDATNLQLTEEMAGFPLYILRMEASSDLAAIRIQIACVRRLSGCQ